MSHQQGTPSGLRLVPQAYNLLGTAPHLPPLPGLPSSSGVLPCPPSGFCSNPGSPFLPHQGPGSLPEAAETAV